MATTIINSMSVNPPAGKPRKLLCNVFGMGSLSSPRWVLLSGRPCLCHAELPRTQTAPREPGARPARRNTCGAGAWQ